VLDSIEETKLPDGKAGGGVRAYAVDHTTRALTLLNASATADPPCHAAIDNTGRILVAVSYGGGQVSAFPVLPDGRRPWAIAPHSSSTPVPAPVPTPSARTNPTLAPPRFLPTTDSSLVCDLGQDRVHADAVDAANASPSRPRRRPLRPLPPAPARATRNSPPTVATST